MKRINLIVLVLGVLTCLMSSTVVEAAEKDNRELYKEINSQNIIELWQVKEENVDSLNVSFAQLLSSTEGIENLPVKYKGKITLKFLTELSGKTKTPVYQGYAKLNIENSTEGYVFATTVEKLKNGNSRITGWYVDIDGKLLTQFDIEAGETTYQTIAQKIAASYESNANMNSSSSSKSSNEDSNQNSNVDSRPSQPIPSAPQPPTPPSDPDDGITDPTPIIGEIPGPTVG